MSVYYSTYFRRFPVAAPLLAEKRHRLRVVPFPLLFHLDGRVTSLAFVLLHVKEQVFVLLEQVVQSAQSAGTLFSFVVKAPAPIGGPEVTVDRLPRQGTLVQPPDRVQLSTDRFPLPFRVHLQIGWK